MPLVWDFSVFKMTSDQESLDAQFLSLKVMAIKLVEKYQYRLVTSETSIWLEYFQESNVFSQEITRIAQLVSLQGTQDSNNLDLQKKVVLVEAKMSDLSTIILPLAQVIKNLDTLLLSGLLSNPELKAYKNYFQPILDAKIHQLSEKEEMLLSLKAPALGNYIQIYDTLTGIHMYQLNTKSVTEGEVRALRTSTDSDLRKKGFELLADYYGSQEQQILRAGLYYGLVSDWVSDAKLRNYPSSISVRNLSEQVTDKEVGTLLTKVESNYPFYQEYLSYKASKINSKSSDKLAYTNVFAPINNQNSSFSWEQGWNIVKKTLSQLHPDLESYLTKMLDEGRIDVMPQKGKRGGAFASYNPYFGQFVQLNYTGDIDAVSTLAHELGHAFHGELSQNQPEQVFHTPLVLAESASTFFQLLIIDELRSQQPELSERLLSELLEDFFATVTRQVQYVRFEQRMHAIIWEGGVFDSEALNVVWQEEVEKMLGEAVDLEPRLYRNNWSAIPHLFHTPFYCYAYSYGLLFALSLYNQYKTSGTPKVLFQILELGGSASPEDMRVIAGIDSLEDFLDEGFVTARKWLDELQNLQK